MLEDHGYVGHGEIIVLSDREDCLKKPAKGLPKPQQNAFIERYNRTVRGEWLGQYLFETIDVAQEQATEWLWTYNNEQLNMGIGGIAAS